MKYFDENGNIITSFDEKESVYDDIKEDIIVIRFVSYFTNDKDNYLKYINHCILKVTQNLKEHYNEY